ECKAESFDRKIDQYLRCLNAIVDCKHEQNKKQEKAKLLLKRYKEGDRTGPDYQSARKWKNERDSAGTIGPSFQLYNPTFTGDVVGNLMGTGSISGTSFNSSKRDKYEENEKDSSKVQKRTKIDDYFLVTSPLQHEQDQHPRTPEHRIYSASDFVSSRIQEDKQQQSIDKNHSGNILPDGTKLMRPPPAPDFISLKLEIVLVKDIFAKNLSQHTEMLKNKNKLTAEEKATLRYGVSRVIDLSAHMRVWFTEIERQDIMKDYEEILKIPELTEDINKFIAKIEKMVREGDVNGAHKYCLNQHADASVNTCLQNNLYNVKDGNDLLYCGGEHHTEIDVIVKTCAYIVNGLQNGTGIHSKWGESFCPLSQSANHERGRKCDVRFLSHMGIDLGEWEFSAQATPTKTIEDRCRSARINQSILNGLLSKDLTDTQVDMIKVPYLQIAGVFGQLLVEDLVNGFYIVYPGPIFEIPTKLIHIRKLKSAIISFKHIMEMYKKVNEVFDELNHSRNLLEDIFKVDGVKSSQHNSRKSVFIHKPWWSPKSQSQKSQVLTAIEEMEK
ncbi:6231_t:CDS:2, partial [Funneliformis geosporum]